MIDWTLNVGTLVQIAVLVSGIMAFTIKVRSDVASVKNHITDIKEELKELRKVFTVQVDHDGRLSRAEDDIREMRSDIKEMRHGEGFVLPLRSHQS